MDAAPPSLTAVVMPKWGLAMEEGTLTDWRCAEGGEVAAGAELAEIETSKIANVLEAPGDGRLLRQVVAPGTCVPVGALLGVIGDPATPAAGVDAFITAFDAAFVPPEPGQQSALPERRRLGLADGRTLSALTLGAEHDSAPIVLLHGFGADLDGWQIVHGTLAEQRTVHALDLPGHGQSSLDPADATIPGLAADVHHALQTLASGAVHLVGHSLGGGVALALACQWPEAVSRLTLIAPCGLGPEIDGSFIAGFLAAGRRREMRNVLGRLVDDPALVSAEMVESVLRFKRLDGAGAALARTAAACFAGDRQLWQYPQTHPLPPVRIVHGANDRIIPPQHSATLSGSGLSVLEDSGHVPHLEQPQAVIRAITA